jgi:hypothetical protein
MTGEFFPPGKLPRARSLVQKIRQVYVKQPLARYLLLTYFGRVTPMVFDFRQVEQFDH